MAKVFSNIEYNLEGDTYFAESSDGEKYLVYTEYDMRRELYTIETLKEIGGEDGERVAVGKTRYAETGDEVLTMIKEIIAEYR